MLADITSGAAQNTYTKGWGTSNTCDHDLCSQFYLI